MDPSNTGMYIAFIEQMFITLFYILCPPADQTIFNQTLEFYGTKDILFSKFTHQCLCLKMFLGYFSNHINSIIPYTK